MPRWAEVVVALMLVAPFLVMGFIYLRHHYRLRVWTRAEATVVGVETVHRSDGNGGTETTSTVTYTFHDASENQHQGTTVNPEPVLRRGETVDVAYHPSEPDRSTVIGSLWRHHLALGAFFLLFVPGVLLLIGVTELPRS